MPIVCVGINYRTAPVALRERLAFVPSELHDVLASPRLHDAGAALGLSEFVLLSTCNRTELYAATADVTGPLPDDPAPLATALAESRGVTPAVLAPHLYRHTGGAALRHLCRVATGLDSMVLGESEILGQVSAALELGTHAGTVGRVLGAGFHAALRAGRRARTETGICRCPMSVSAEAVRVLVESGWEPAGSRVLIIGAGKMARLAGEVLRAHGATDLRVAGRTAARAQALARALEARPVVGGELGPALREADVVFSATSAPHAVVTRALVESARRGAPSARPLLCIDVAVPRDVEPAVRAVPGVRVFDLDDLQRRLQENRTSREREIPAVEAIIEEELQYFEEWRHGAELRPLLAAWHQRSEAIRQRELGRALRRLQGVSPEVHRQLEAFSRSLVSKLLHEPTRRLREETDPSRCDAYVRATRDLFGLDDDTAAPVADVAESVA
jgi:glutamyl-tRNA reductase